MPQVALDVTARTDTQSYQDEQRSLVVERPVAEDKYSLRQVIAVAATTAVGVTLVMLLLLLLSTHHDDNSGNNDQYRVPSSQLDASTDVATCVDCPSYIRASADQKLERMWTLIEGTEYSTFPNDWISLSDNVAAMARTAFNGTINESFDRFSDQYMTEHAKVIHTHGTVAKVRLVWEEEHPYTGLFGEGESTGLIRASLVKDPNAPCTGIPFTPGCFAPGIAVKVLRDQTFSSNLIAMSNLGDGQGRDFNFFKNPMKTWVPKPVGLGADVVNGIFAYAAAEPNRLGSVEFAASDPSADVTSTSIKAPSNVYFVPTSNIATRFKSTDHEFRADFAELVTGSVLYEVWAPGNDGCLCGETKEPCMDPRKCEGAQQIGRLETTSRFVSSRWGDQSLFFQHERHARKERRLCTMASSMSADDVFRMPDDFSTRCMADGTTCDAGETTKRQKSWELTARRRVTGKLSGQNCPFS